MKEHMLVVDVQAEFHYLAPPGTEQDRIIRAQQNAIASVTAHRLLPKFRQMILDEIAGRSAPETAVDHQRHVQTFTRVGPEQGMSTMCECGQTFAKHIAQDHAGNACVCPTANRGESR